MERLLLCIVIALLLVAAGAPGVRAASNAPFLALCFHNVEDADPDQSVEGVTTGKLVEQLSWLQHQGYQAVSINDLLAARAGIRPLPKKAMLLTFDDGYESFYTRVYPILRAFHYPAVIGLVDEWMKEKGHAVRPGETVQFGNKIVPRRFFLTWEQVREMEKSGLVEVASHSHALHSGIPANPQGNVEPAAVTAQYDPHTKTYEMPQDYLKRLNEDAGLSAHTIAKKTGHRPRAIIWPYGAYNQTAIMVEKTHAMPVTLTLDDGFATVDRLQAIPRYFEQRDPSLADFVIDYRELAKQQPMRVVQVDLDYIYDPDPKQMAHNLDALVSRIYKLRINTVFLQAFADPKGTGLAKELYFPSRYLPMRADLFNRVVWQLKTRAHVQVYGWLPVLSFDFGDAASSVLAWSPAAGKAERDPKAYRRLSPFDPEARRRIIGVYKDMARHAAIDGILFHDDGRLSDFEDASQPALSAYARAGFPSSIAAIRINPALMKKWTDFKINALIEFTQELADSARLYRSPLRTVRDIYAPLLLEPESREWFAQDYSRFLTAYDYTAVMAMPEMENVPESEAGAWLRKLVAAAARQPGGLKHTVFELQSVDWRNKDGNNSRAIPAEKLEAQMRFLLREGALNFGYYPDDFVTNVPDAAALHKEFSLQAYPYLP